MKKNLPALAVAAFATFAFTPLAAFAQDAGPFAKGRTHFVATGGAGSAFGDSYLVLGLGLQYYLVDGLSAGLAFESWSGGNPGLKKVTPSVQYVFYQAQLKPYIGAFYRRTYIEGLSDLDSAGVRGGVHFAAGRNAYIGVGAVYESYIDCRENVYRSCSNTYPEVSLTISF